MARIIGTESRDVLNGTAGDDHIEGLGGPDQLRGGGGNDLLLGGEGSDGLDGGSGNDRVEGGTGNDSISDHEGGDDLLFGDEGDDFISMRREIFRAVQERIEIHGGVGNDRINYHNASAVSALIDAGDGDDTVSIERSSLGTVVALGAGQDWLNLSELQFVPGRVITIADFETGTSGDRINFWRPLGYYLDNWNQSLNPFGTGHLRFRQDGSDAVLQIDTDGTGPGSGFDLIVFKNVQVSTFSQENLDGYTFDGSLPPSLNLTGTDEFDRLVGNGGHDLIEGGLGDDTLEGRGGDDVLRGGGGVDTIQGGAGNDLIQGGDGGDYLSDSSGGSDTIEGGDGDDWLSLYRLNHSLNENVIMRGGAGIDVFDSWSYARGTVLLDGGSGSDEFVLRTSNNTHTLTLGTGIDTIFLDRFQPSEMLTTSRVVTDFETGSSGDRVGLQSFLTSWTEWNGVGNPFETGHLKLVQRGSDAVLQAIGVKGIDAGRPGDGDLLIFQNRTTASFTAENFSGLSPNGVPPGFLTITGTEGADTLEGSFGNDLIDGRGGDDLLKGSAGNDILFGGDGRDTIHGGDGNDVLRGGAGDDFLEANHERGSDQFLGEEGADSIFVYRVFSGAEEHVIIDAGTGDDRVTYQNFDQGSVTIDLGVGADHLSLWGARGSSRITLGDGMDEVDFDRHYVSLLGEFTITIADYRVGEDRLSWGSYFARELVGWNQQTNPFATGHLLLAQNGADVELRIDRDGAGSTYGATPFLMLQNVMMSSLTRADFGGLPPDGTDVDRMLSGTEAADDLTGGTGNDMLDGGLGDDRLDGGRGNDVLIGGEGRDTMIGGAGADTFYVDSSDDVVADASSGGYDRLATSVSYRLSDTAEIERFEAITLSATTALNLTGNIFSNTIVGNNGVNMLDGGGGNDELIGLGGNDVLIGGGGDDRLAGGLGDDVHFVDSAGDVVIEVAGEGNDRVAASASFVLGAGAAVERIEAITLSGTTSLNLGGNEFAQSIIGNAGTNLLDGGGGDDQLQGVDGNDVLVGGAGRDVLFGGAGDDVYFVDGGDEVYELAGEGFDRVAALESHALRHGSRIERLEAVAMSGTSALNLAGNEFAQSIAGNNGSNLLDGGGGDDELIGLGGDDALIGGDGADVLRGGIGNDVYYVDAGDTVFESSGEGVDRVAALTSYALAAGSHVERIEAITLSATTALNLSGNELSQTILGNAGANVIDGGASGDELYGLGGNDVLIGGLGADALYGGAGDDVFFVDDTSDAVLEGAGEGSDRVAASVSYTLRAGAEVETLEFITLSSTLAVSLTGNELANTVIGNNGANILDGKGGNDTLVGAGGADIFQFSTALGTGNVDTIAGFEAGLDRIALTSAIFGGLGAGPLSAAAFVNGAAAADTDDRIIFDGNRLFYDADGTGAAAQIQFATVHALSSALSAGDFFVI